MNTKIIAILMASIVAMATVVPMAMSAPATTSATVGNVAPTIACTDCPGNVDLEPETMAGAVNTTVWINGTVDDGNCYPDIDAVTCNASAFGANLIGVCSCGKAEVAGDPPTDGIFNCSFDLDGCTPEGDYNVYVTVNDTVGANDTCNCTVHINGGIGLELDFNTIDYGAVNIGVPKNIIGDNVWGGASRTVHNTANQAMNVTINATDMTRVAGGDAILAEELNATVDAVGPKWLVENNTVEFEVCMGCCNLTNMDFGINVNRPVLPGAYTGNMIIEPKVC